MVTVIVPKNKAGYFLGVNVALGGSGPLGSHDFKRWFVGEGWVEWLMDRLSIDATSFLGLVMNFCVLGFRSFLQKKTRQANKNKTPMVFLLQQFTRYSATNLVNVHLL